MLSRGIPLAQVTLTSGSLGNVVNVEVEGGTAEVTLGHSGPVKLEPVPEASGLKVTLHQFDVRALALGRYEDVEQALSEASWASRDNLAEEVLRATQDEELAHALEREDGRWVLTRLYDEVTSGHVSQEQSGQAQRVLATWAQYIGLAPFVWAIEDKGTKVFPVRKSGPTVTDAVSPTVQASPRGLEVSLSTNVYKYPEHQTLKLNGTTHVSVRHDEVVGVKLYDAGGAVRYLPALFLIEVSNAGARHTLQKCGEMFALGFTAGLGVGAGAVGAAASPLVWCDRAAVAMGLALSVVDDHRGEILARFGEKGARFLYATDVLASLVAFYGLGRVVVSVPRAVRGLRQAYLEMRASKAALSPEEEVLLGRTGHGVDELLEQAEKASKGGEVIPIERARKPSPPPAVEEQPLRATGTDVRLVPVGQQPTGPKAVASAGGSKPPAPLTPAAPSFQAGGARASVERGASAPRPSPGSEAAGVAAIELPTALRGGEATTHVYFGVRDGKRVYVGITDDLARRAAEHGSRFEIVRITSAPVTRGEARAIEEALIAHHPGFENIRHSIDPSYPWYRQAVEWGEAWLKGRGF